MPAGASSIPWLAEYVAVVRDFMPDAVESPRADSTQYERYRYNRNGSFSGFQSARFFR
ncbi:hypothetical protein FHS27_005855 [Rhodopirellula rubra]|uniref:Uncharacterized protein n=1 Tax=Aporhodopirellula rubra TaxID=980271 RepID=A0A7W5H931_9BACT|nr:hypothetical protein [Aporhodopirellula rubra]